MMYQQINIWVRQRLTKKNLLVFLYLINLITAFIPQFFSAANHSEECFNRLFSHYLSYTAFRFIEVSYIVFSLPLFYLLRKWISNIGAFVVFELIWVVIIFAYFRIYFCWQP